MPDGNDKIKVLYDAVSKDYNLGTEQEFRSKLSSPDKRKAFFEGVGAEYQLGTFDEFESKIGFPKIDVAGAERARGIKSFKQFAAEQGMPILEMRAAAEGTRGPDLAMKAQMQRDVEEAPERKRVREEKERVARDKALINTTKKKLENSGIKFTEGDPIWKKNQDEIRSAVGNNELALSVDSQGNPVYKRKYGFFESYWKTLQESLKDESESEKFLSADINEKIKMADETLSRDTEGVAQWFPEVMAGATIPVMQATVGGMAGTALAPGAGTAAGILGSIMAMSPSAYNKGYKNTSIQMYKKEIDDIKAKKGTVTDKDKIDAMGRATTQGVYGGIGDVAFGAGLVLIPAGNAAAGAGLRKALVNFGKHTAMDASKQAVLGMTIASAKDVAASASGYNVSAAESINNVIQSGKAGVETAVAFSAYHAAGAIPKYVNSAAKNYLSTVPRLDLNNMSKTLEAKGVIPEGATEKMNADLDNFQKSKSAVPNIVPEEDMGSFAGLVEKKNKLIEQKKSSDPSFHPKIDEQISAIDERIKKMQESKDPIVDEVDDLTGDTGEAEPHTEEVIKKSVELVEPTQEEIKAVEKPAEEVAMVSKDVAPEGAVEIKAETPIEVPKVEEKPVETKPEEVVKKEGTGGMVKFAEGVEIPYKYKIIESDEVKPSHLPSGERNPEHSIALAQPKERGDIQSKLAQEKIAASPNLGEVGESPNPYFGAPVVNQRGEVIQGNNRSLGLKRHYEEGGSSYKKQLADNAEKFGMTREQVEGMKNPVLVRETAIDDAMAIELGNYDVKDLETGGKQRIDPITTVRKMAPEDKNKLAAIIFDGDYSTVKEAIRDNQQQVGSIISKQINAAQRNTIFDKEGNINPKGMEDIENIVNNMLFESGPAVLPEAFNELSYNQQKNIQKAIKHIFNTPEGASILPEVQNAVLGIYDFRKSGIDNFNAWLAQADIFEGKTPRDIFSPVEIKIMETLNKAKTQSELSKQLSAYAELVKGKPADMFEPERAGIPKAEAIKKTFNVEYEDVTKRYAEPESKTPTEGGLLAEEPRVKIEGATEAEQSDFDAFTKRELARPEFDAEYRAERVEGESKESYILRKYCP